MNSGLFQTELVWFDRTGNRLGAGIPADKFSPPALARNGKPAVFERMDPKTNTSALWKLDVDRGELSLFAADGSLPIYFPDGSTVAFSCNIEGKSGICRKSSGGAAGEEMLWNSGRVAPVDFSPDGRVLSFVDPDPEVDRLQILPLTGERLPRPFYRSEFGQSQGTFSPDGKWIAYASSETGDHEVYVQPFPATGEKWKVSTHGGAQARWGRDGKELFYRTIEGKMMAVSVKTSGGFESGVPHMWFSSPADPLFPGHFVRRDRGRPAVSGKRGCGRHARGRPSRSSRTGPPRWGDDVWRGRWCLPLVDRQRRFAPAEQTGDRRNLSTRDITLVPNLRTWGQIRLSPVCSAGFIHKCPRHKYAT